MIYSPPGQDLYNFVSSGIPGFSPIMHVNVDHRIPFLTVQNLYLGSFKGLNTTPVDE